MTVPGSRSSIGTGRSSRRRRRGRLGDLIAKTACLHPTRGLRAALIGTPGLAVIAEIKRRSPAKGDLNRNLDAAELAASYERGGAAASPC